MVFFLGNTESVLQKFRKTFSLHFQKRGGSKESGSCDIGDAANEILPDPSEEDSPQHQPHVPGSNTHLESKEEPTEQKYRWAFFNEFGIKTPNTRLGS